MSFGSFATRVVATKVVATDGTGDFTDIQSAIDDLPSDGGVVYIKEGTYTLTTGLTLSTDNVIIYGSSRSTIIQGSGTITLFTMDSINNIVLRDLSLTTLSGSVTIIEADSCNQCFISNCYINGSAGGIILSSSSECVVEHCDVKPYGGFSIDISGSDNVIKNNFLTQHIGGGIRVSSGSGNIIDGNRAFPSAVGLGGADAIVITSSGNIIINNHTSGSIGNGIRLTEASNCIVSNNYCYNHWILGVTTRDGIYLSGNSDRNLITGNQCLNSDGYGINISAATCDKNIIDGNVVYNNTTGQINDSGTNTVVGDNVTT